MTRTATRIILILLLLLSPVFAAEQPRVFIFYYAWYANPSYDNQWQHWQHNGHQPPFDIASSFYPKFGAYSSRDPNVIDQHLRWIAQANVPVLIYSWWGRKDFTNKTAPLVLDAAIRYGVKVCFMIEPYEERTVHSIQRDIHYLLDQYGSHAAFLRISRATANAPTVAQRPVFFIYHADYPLRQLRQLSDSIHGSRDDSILLLQSTNAALIDRARVDGIFAYDAVKDLTRIYAGVHGNARKRNGIFIPCVSPGFNINRTSGRNRDLFRSRLEGKTYDRWWEKTLRTAPEFVSIISFNEWHEGTQIEPAIEIRRSSIPYLSYSKAYGKNGTRAQFSYLHRTARWIRKFQEMALP